MPCVLLPPRKRLRDPLMAEAEGMVKKFLKSVLNRFGGERPQAEYRPEQRREAENREPVTQEEQEPPQDIADAKRLIKYLQTNEQQRFNYSELDQATEEELGDLELIIRKDYATFVDQFPDRTRRNLPTFAELKTFSHPEDGNQDQLQTPDNPYLRSLSLIEAAVPDKKLEGMGFVNLEEQSQEDWPNGPPPEPDIHRLSDLVIGRFQTFVIGSEMLDEAMRKYKRFEQGRAFNK